MWIRNSLIAGMLSLLCAVAHADGIGGGIGGSNGIGNGVGDPSGISATKITLTPPTPSALLINAGSAFLINTGSRLMIQ